VKIRSFVHKGLRRLYLEDSTKGLPPDAVDKLRAMLTFLQDMQDPEKLRAFPLWKAHQLTGDRKGVWSLNVTRNWRLTFQIKDGEILDVDYDLTVAGAARILRVSRPTLSSLLNAKADLSGDMALRFEKAFGVDMDTLMRMQSSYDIARTRSREKKIRVKRYQPQPAA
jgi:proteic killer suppression protein